MPTRGPWIQPAATWTEEVTNQTAVGITVSTGSLTHEPPPPSVHDSVVEALTGSHFWDYGGASDSAYFILAIEGGSAAECQFTYVWNRLNPPFNYAPIFDLAPPGASIEFEAPLGVPDGLIRFIGYVRAHGSGGQSRDGWVIRNTNYFLGALSNPLIVGVPWAQWGGTELIRFTGGAGTDIDTPVLIETTLDAGGYAVFTLVHDVLIDQLAWDVGDGADALFLTPPKTATGLWLQAHYLPPRYRYVFPIVPPLRQRARGDFTTRAREKMSRQVTNRQGPPAFL